MSDTQGAAPSIVATGDPITQMLTGAFAEQDAPPAPVDQEPAAPEPVEEPAVPDEAPEAAPDEIKTDEETVPDDEAEAGNEGDEPGESDDDNPDEELDYPTEDELKARLPRAVPLKVVRQFARYVDEAREGTEMKTALGGSPFIQPLAKISEALRSTDTKPEAFVPFFTGIMEAAGDEALSKVIGQSIYMGFVQGPEWANNPETKEFGDKLHEMADKAVQMRFGTTIEEMERATSFARDGSLDKVLGWIEDGYVSSEDLAELKAIRSDPVKQRLSEENLALKRQQEKPAAEVKPTQDQEGDAAFTSHIGSAVDNVLDDVVLKSSPLREDKSDSPELKEHKAYFRNALAQKAREAVARSAENAKLQTGFRQGKQRTAVYQSDLATLFLEKILPDIDKDRQQAEQIISQLYGKTRNAQLKAKETVNGNTPAAPPAALTVPTDFKPQANGTKSIREIEKDLEVALG